MAGPEFGASPNPSKSEFLRDAQNPGPARAPPRLPPRRPPGSGPTRTRPGPVLLLLFLFLVPRGTPGGEEPGQAVPRGAASPPAAGHRSPGWRAAARRARKCRGDGSRGRSRPRERRTDSNQSVGQSAGKSISRKDCQTESQTDSQDCQTVSPSIRPGERTTRLKSICQSDHSRRERRWLPAQGSWLRPPPPLATPRGGVCVALATPWQGSSLCCYDHAQEWSAPATPRGRSLFCPAHSPAQSPGNLG